MPRLTDLWRSAIVPLPMAELLTRGTLEGIAPSWLPQDRDFTFLADPFGLWRGPRLHVFVERFDYRDRHGVIEVLTYDAQMQLLTRHTCLHEPWHLSYPFVFEAEGETWMLPEAHRSGRLTLYRACEFPQRWEPAAVIAEVGAAVDATPVFHQGLWWLLYCLPSSKAAKVSALHLAFAERLSGPWRRHPGNPVRIDRASARPGGTPLRCGDALVAPMQDCTHTYGGAISPLHIARMDPQRFEADAVPPIVAPMQFAPYLDGLHTLAACGDVTLVDCKRIDRSLRGLAIDLRRWLG